jgi:hypothetical protein
MRSLACRTLVCGLVLIGTICAFEGAAGAGGNGGYGGPPPCSGGGGYQSILVAKIFGPEGGSFGASVGDRCELTVTVQPGSVIVPAQYVVGLTDKADVGDWLARAKLYGDAIFSFVIYADVDGKPIVPKHPVTVDYACSNVGPATKVFALSNQHWSEVPATALVGELSFRASLGELVVVFNP